MDLPQTLASPAARNFLEAKPWLAGWVGGWLVCVCARRTHAPMGAMFTARPALTENVRPCSAHIARVR